MASKVGTRVLKNRGIQNIEELRNMCCRIEGWKEQWHVDSVIQSSDARPSVVTFSGFQENDSGVSQGRIWKEQVLCFRKQREYALTPVIQG